MDPNSYPKTSHLAVKNNFTEFKSQEPKKRAKQISGLHVEFEELKKKIRDVQNKNERIIEKIHSAFNFKKKGAYVQDQSDQEDEYTQNAFDNRQRYEPIMMNYVGVQNDSQIGLQSKAMKNYTNVATDYQTRNYSNGSSAQNMITPIHNTRSKSPKVPSTRHLQSPQYQTYSTVEYNSSGRNIHLQSLLKIEKSKVIELSQKLQRKEQEHFRLQNIEQRFRTYAQNSKVIIENHLSNFIQSYVRNCMIGIEKGCKRNQMKLLNLAVQVRESNEDRKSAKVIKEHQNRRSESRSLKKPDRANSRTDLNRSQVKINVSADPAKKNKQFQQIALKYEQIIKGKNEQNENLDKKLKNKEIQITQLKNRIEAISRKLKEEERKTHELESTVAVRNMKDSFGDQELHRKLSQQELTINQEKANYKILSLKFQEVQKSFIEKDNQIEFLKQANTTLENKLSSLETLQKRNQNTSRIIQRLQSQLRQKSENHYQIQSRCSQVQKKLMQRECQLFGINSKLQKMEQAHQMKEKKIQELQKLLHVNQQVLDRSAVLQTSMTVSKFQNRNQDVRRLIQDNQKVEEQLENKRNQVFSLVKQRDYAQTRIIELEGKVTLLKKQLEMLQEEGDLRSFRSSNANSSNNGDGLNFEELEEERKKLQEDLNQMSQKCSGYSKTIQSLRTQNLEVSSKLMKAESQLQFVRDNLQEKESSYQKIKSQNESLRIRLIQLQKTVNQQQCQLEMERKSYQQRIEDLQNKWSEFEENIENERNMEIGFDGRSEKSSVVNFKSNYNILNTQNEYLTQKLKQAQALIETQNIMEQRIIQQYRLNVEKVKTDLKEKCSLIDKISSELERNRKRVKHLEAREKEQSENYEDNMLERVEQLQQELKETKQINNKLTEMSNELFQQIKTKQEDKNDILRQVQYKNNRIVQLQEILDAKEIPIASRASLKSKIKEAQKSQLSHNLQRSHSSLPHQATIDFDLSIEHSFIDNSQLNVSDLFRDLPHQKLKLRTREHKLFEKTASYIASLKEMIADKSKRIRILQKKIESLKSSQLVRKDYDLSGKQQLLHHVQSRSQMEEVEGVFKDYESVDFDTRKGSHHKRFKMLQHDTKLVVQQNNMLVQQIEVLQQEIIRAQEQENSLVKIKDLYKDEIKKLIKKNQETIKTYEEQLQKERGKVEDSQAVHNFEALRQLFIKIFGAMLYNQTGKKREEKKKELQEYVKVVCSILKIPQTQKDSIIDRLKNSD